MALFFYLILSVVWAQDRDSLSPQLYAQIKSSVFQIKSSISKDSPKTSYGSGFVIDKTGLLLTNFHVVSDAVVESDKYQIFLIDGENSLPAQVLAIDVTQDMALLKVDKKFNHTLKMADRLPFHGEPLFSIGIPEDLNMTLVRGIYNGVLESGPYSKIHMSSPINSGMSGGPTVNRLGQVVGMNVSKLRDADSVSFSVPLASLQKFLNSQRARGFQPYKDLRELAYEQLTAVQDRLTTDMQESMKKSKDVFGYMTAKMPSYMRCWSNHLNEDQRYFKAFGEKCGLNDHAMLSAEEETGWFEVSYSVLEKNKMNRLQFFAQLNDWFIETQNSLSFIRKDWKTPMFTSISCKAGRVQTKAGLKFKVETCLRGHTFFKNLYDAEVKWASLDRVKTGIVTQVSIRGFSFAHIESLVKTLMDSMELKGKK